MGSLRGVTRTLPGGLTVAGEEGETTMKSKQYSFQFKNIDFGDSDHDDFTRFVWVAAWVDGRRHVLGAYVWEDGQVVTVDNQGWTIDDDLEEMGFNPESEEAEQLVEEWKEAARKKGLAEIERVLRNMAHHF